jgi:type II secretion system protein D
VNVPPSPKVVVRLLSVCVLAGAIYLGFQLRKPQRALAQNTAAGAPSSAAGNTAGTKAAANTNAASTNATSATNAATSSASTNAASGSTNATVVVVGSTNSAPPTNAVAAAPAPGGAPGIPPGAGPGQPGQPADEPPGADVQLSFQNAQVDMIVQWLAKHTGKSVVKHKAVQCQLTIVSSKKMPSREALNLVYRALALEGFNVIETSKSILIVPDAQDPKVAPELVNGGGQELPEGRQRLMRIFQLENVPPADMRDKIKSVLSEKAVVDVVDRANQLIVTDYTENIRLASELIKELDVPSGSDMTIEFFKVKHADVDEITTLLTQILNAQPPAPKSSSSSGPTPGPSGPSSSRSSGPMPMPGPSGPPSGPPPGQPSAGPAVAGTGGGQVKIWPDKNANQLIVSAPKSRIQEIRDLLAVLDVEREEDVTMRVITLQNVSAEDLVKEISPLYQRMSGKGPKDKVEVTANTRSNSLIVYSSEENFKQIQKLVAALDREDAAERVMRVFPLTNADAEDVAKQLDTLSEGSQSSQNRYPFYIYSFGGSSPQGPKKPSFVADRRRNAVIVQAPPASIDEIAKLIEQLDAPMGGDALAPKIFRLKYVSAVDIEEVLNELFLQKQQQRNYWDPFSGYYGGSSGSTRDSTGGKLYGKVRITSEPYSNSLIVTSNSPEGLAAVEEVLKELDSPSQAGETTMRMTLNFARANTIASSLNVLFAKGGSPPFRQQPQQQPQGDPRVQQQQQTSSSTQAGFTLEQEAKEDPYYSWLGGNPDSPFGRAGDRNTQRPVSDLIGRVRIVPDRRSNSLLITANLHFFPQIIKMVKELDEPTPQVMIEAKIIEVSSDFRDKLGTRWSPDPRTFSGEDLDDSVLGQTGVSYKDVFGGTLPAADATRGVLRSGVFDSSVNLNVLIQFLRKNVDAKVLAEPQLNILDNEVGKLFVGAQVPFLKGSLNTAEGGRNDTFDYRDVGVILEVVPHVNNANEIALKIRTESSSIRSGETLFGAFIIDTRNFKTDLTVKDQETVVLGGIIQRELSDTQRKVPGLGSVPGLGWLFKKRDKGAREVELMVFLRPRITRTPEQAAELFRETEQKVPLIRNWEENAPALKPANGGQKNSH